MGFLLYLYEQGKADDSITYYNDIITMSRYALCFNYFLPVKGASVMSAYMWLLRFKKKCIILYFITVIVFLISWKRISIIFYVCKGFSITVDFYFIWMPTLNCRHKITRWEMINWVLNFLITNFIENYFILCLFSTIKY